MIGTCAPASYAPSRLKCIHRWRRASSSSSSAERWSVIGSSSSRTPGVRLFVEAEVGEGLGRAHARDGADLVVEQREEVVVVLAHDLEQQVERPADDDD